MAAITLLRPPPSLRSPAVVGGPGSITSWNNSHGTRRRPPSIISMSSQSHHQAKTTKQAFSGLRTVHTPAPTPVLGNFSRSSRGAKKNSAGYIPRAATLDCLTSRDLFQNAVALAQTAFRGSFGGEQSIGLMAKASFDNLVQRVMGLLAVADYQIWRLGWFVSRHKDILLSQLLPLVSWYLLEHIFREGFTMVSFGMWGSTLNKCGTDVTKLAKEGKFDPVIGRQKQVDQAVQILSRRSKNSPCLIGEPGVGKTAIVEGLAQLIASGDVPETIKGKKVISIDVPGLRAGQVYHGQFEARVKNLLREVKRSGKIILFIDEIHTLVGAGTQNEGYMDVANVFKPALARGEMQVIGATTIDEYRKHIEKDAALERRFVPVKVPEPTVDETVGILRGLRERYEKHHNVQYADEALRAAAELSHKYISDRFLPDKAIDLIDQSGSLASLRHAQQKPSMDVRDLEAELSRIVKEKNDAVRNESYKRVI